MYIYNLFKNIVETVPNKVAIKYGNNTITYEELLFNAMYNAEKLKDKGVQRGDIIAIYMKNSIEAVISMLSILKVGAIVLPIDKDIPQYRLDKIILDSKINYILINEDTVLTDYTLAETIKIDINNQLIKKESINYNGVYNRDSFCIYTSGSTGSPKGILLKNDGILNHINSKIKLLKLNTESILCQSLSLSFVAAIWQIITPIIIGAKLIIYDSDTIKNPFILFKSAEKDNVSAISVVPQSLKSFLVMSSDNKRLLNFNSIKNIILTGEKLDSDVVNRFYKKHDVQLINAYGQSECSDDTFHYIIPRNIEISDVPIGYPIDNISVYVLDKNLNEVKKGSIGELYISGQCLATGYINNNIEMDKSFIFSKKFGTNLLKTGDLVKETSNGSYLYIGRVDNQINFRGYRISPEEIECILLGIEDILKVVVTIDEIKSNEKILVAVYESKREIEPQFFINYLKSKVPNYMIPSKYIYMYKIPITISGKIDRFSIIKNPLKEVNDLDKGILISEKIINIIKNNIDDCFNEYITESTYISQIGIDSLNFISIILDIEKEFELEFEDDMILLDKYNQVKDFVKYIQEYKKF